MNEKVLYVLSGCPGSGKSTWANLKVAMEKPNVIVVSRDSIRERTLAGYGYFEPDSNCGYFDHENEVFSIYVNSVQECLDSGFGQVIADATQVNSKSRNKLLSKLDLRDYKVRIVYFNTDLDTCFERNKSRVGFSHVPESAIYNMYNSREQITEKEIEKGYEMVELNG